MERILARLHHIQSYPEATRRRLLWVSVCSLCVLIGMLWLAMLSWQFSRVSSNSSPPAVHENGNLPTIPESVGTTGASLGSAARQVLRRALLGDEQVTQSTVDTSSPAPGPPTPRLPRSQ